MRRVQTTDGLALAVEQHGEGPAVVLVHGLGFDRLKWSAQVEALVSSGYAVVTWDLRGFGDSGLPRGPYGIQQLVDDLESVRRSLELERFHLVGHSLGGMLAQCYTLAHPDRVRSLTLISTSSHSGQRGSAYGAALAHLSKLGFDKAMEDQDFKAKVEFAVHALADPEVRKQLDGTLSDELPSGEALLAWIRKLTLEPSPARAWAWGVTVGFSTRHELGQVSCPALVLHGTKDRVIPYVAGELLHTNLTDSRFRGFPGIGHDLPMKCAAEVNEALLDLLRSE